MSRPVLPPARRIAAEDRDLPRRVRDLEVRANATPTGDTAWTYPTLAATLTSSTANPVRYRKDASGIVHIHGGFIRSTGGTFAGGVLFTLPTGYRPKGSASGAASERLQHLMFVTNGASILGQVSVRGDTGDVRLESSLSNGEYAEFGSLTFYADL